MSCDADLAGDGALVPVALDGARLVDACWSLLGGVTRRAVGPTIAAGGVTVDGVAGEIAQPVVNGQRLQLTPEALHRLELAGKVIPPSTRPLAVVHEDDRLLVVDKPAGVHVHPMGPHRHDTLVGSALWHAGARPGAPWTAFRPAPAHRLDRPTSGLVMFAKTLPVRDLLQELLDHHEIRRTYRAVVHGIVVDDGGTIDHPLGPDPTNPRRRGVLPVAAGGQPARTHWRVIRRGQDRTSLELRLETGRTHQLRAHLAHLGHPIIGDVLYGASPSRPAPDPAVGAVIALRAVRLEVPGVRGLPPLSLVVPEAGHEPGRDAGSDTQR